MELIVLDDIAQTVGLGVNIDLPKHYSVNKTLVVNENLIWITPKTNHVGLGYYLVSLVMVDFFFFFGSGK